MSRVTHLVAVFVQDIPELLEDGILYVSRECRVAMHNCACGCGEEVSTPLVQTEYDLIMDDAGPSIWPSIGNHDFTCGSHYIIRNGRIIWAGKMSRERIEAGRAYDSFLKRGRPTRMQTVAAWLRRLWSKLIG